MAIDPKVQADLEVAGRALTEASAKFSQLRRQWATSLETGDIVKTSFGKSEVVERLPSDDASPHFRLRTAEHGDFNREIVLISPWTAEDEAEQKLTAHRNTVCGAVAQADEGTLAAIDALIKKGSA